MSIASQKAISMEQQENSTEIRWTEDIEGIVKKMKAQ